MSGRQPRAPPPFATCRPARLTGCCVSLRPPRLGRSITELLLLHKRKLVFHLLSAGAYMFGQVLQVIASSSGGFTRVRQCLVGLCVTPPPPSQPLPRSFWRLRGRAYDGCALSVSVFDSVVDVVGIPEATADILGYHKGSWGHKTVHAVLGAYFMLSYPLTKSKLLRASGNVRHMKKEWCHVVRRLPPSCPLSSVRAGTTWSVQGCRALTWRVCLLPQPQIWLYSEDDQVADPRVIEGVIDQQRQQGVDLVSALDVKLSGWQRPLICRYLSRRILPFVCPLFRRRCSSGIIAAT